MQHISTTPFGRRAVTRAQLAVRSLAEDPLPESAPDKWTLLRELGQARAAFGIGDRDLVVLSALISFHPEAQLEAGEMTIVWPSNAALSARAHGMAESTLRRHLAALVAAGLILRHDSPNGKRFAARDAAGGLAVAYGFDLRPLLVRAAEICAAAQAAREAAFRLKRVRETAVLRLRDAGKLIACGRAETETDWSDLGDRHRQLTGALRRKLDMAATEALASAAAELLAEVDARLETALPGPTATPSTSPETEKMSGNALHSERHIQDSKQMRETLEPAKKDGGGSGGARKPDVAPVVADGHDPGEIKLPLQLVTKACPDLLTYAPKGVQNWSTMVAAAEVVRPFLGISADAWTRARVVMGPVPAAITLACILQRVDTIHSPGGYLRNLTERAHNGSFTPGPMVMALLNTSCQRPS